MCSAVLRPTELKLGTGVGFGKLGGTVNFCRDPTGERSSRGQFVQECRTAAKFGHDDR